MKLIPFSLFTIVAATLALAAPCFWGHSVFSGSNSCTSQDCGYGCGDPYDLTYSHACYTNGSQCCYCNWDRWKCDCTFGTGWGVSADRVVRHNHVCSGGYCIPIE